MCCSLRLWTVCLACHEAVFVMPPKVPLALALVLFWAPSFLEVAGERSALPRGSRRAHGAVPCSRASWRGHRPSLVTAALHLLSLPLFWDPGVASCALTSQPPQRLGRFGPLHSLGIFPSGGSTPLFRGVGHPSTCTWSLTSFCPSCPVFPLPV